MTQSVQSEMIIETKGMTKKYGNQIVGDHVKLYLQYLIAASFPGNTFQTPSDPYRAIPQPPMHFLRHRGIECPAVWQKSPDSQFLSDWDKTPAIR